MKAEEFVKTFTKEEILDALFHKNCLSERAARNLCVALFEEKSDRLLNEMEQSTSGQKPKSLREFMQQSEKFKKLDRQQEKLSKNFDSREIYEGGVSMDRKETTKFLGQLLINTRFGGAGKHWASEVSIDPWGREAKRVDYMQFSPADQCSISGIEKGIFTCYEVKSCKEDVYSGNGLNFLGEKNYIVTTMECYKDILPDLRSGKFAKHMREQFPESSSYFGVMVAIPDWAEATDEFEKPTPLDAEVRQWKLAVILPCCYGPRKRSMTELLFCMLRSGH